MLSTPDFPIASNTSASIKVPLDNFLPSSSSTIFLLTFTSSARTLPYNEECK